MTDVCENVPREIVMSQSDLICATHLADNGVLSTDQIVSMFRFRQS